MDYRKRLKDLREDNELKQDEIAKIIQTSKQGYSKYERGYRKLPIEDLIKIADFYNVSTDYILGRTDNPEINRGKATTKIKNQINGNNFGKITMK